MCSCKKCLVILIFGIIYSCIESHPTFDEKNQTEINIVTREEWGAVPPSKELIDLSLPVCIDIEYDPTLTIIEKSQWLGEPAKCAIKNLTLPVSKVIIIHTATPGCSNLESCIARVQSIQHYHTRYMPPPRFDDIGYNFLIGGDGSIYVGRGWLKVGEHTAGQNSQSIGIAFIGDYNVIKPTPKQLNATQMLLEVGLKSKILKSDYKLFGHKQFIAVESPGQYVYAAISKWSHFSVEILEQ